MTETLGSASFIATPVWRSTKDDPPPKTIFPVHARRWVFDKWRSDEVSGYLVAENPKTFPSWAPYPDPNDGTTPEDWT
jgi:hypothetical protein